MKRNRLVVALVVAWSCLCWRAESQTVLTPQWMTDLGNGTTDYSCTSGTCSLTGEVWLKSFTVSAGAKVLNKSGNGPLIVRATGTCTIDGTVSGSPVTGSYGITGNGDFGGGGGGGGGGAAAGVTGRTTVVIPGVPIVNGGPGGAAGGGVGHAGVSVQQGQYRMLLSSGSAWPGGGALAGQGGSNGGAGGHGGAPIIFICHTIEFSGTIDVRGGTGGTARANNTGGGGGGGGGYAVLAAMSFTNNSGSVLTAGGAGGSCNGYANCGVGGSGGAGFNVAMTIK